MFSPFGVPCHFLLLTRPDVLHERNISVVVTSVGQGLVVHNPTIRSFTESVLWTVDFHGCFTVPFSPLGGTGRPDLAQQGESGTDEAPAGQACTEQCSGVFQKVLFPLSL